MSTTKFWTRALSGLILLGGVFASTGEVSAQGGSADGGLSSGDALITPGGFDTGGGGGFDSQTDSTFDTGTGGGLAGEGSSDIEIGGLIGELGGEIEPPPNNRYFGFVGQSGDRLNEIGFVGGYSEFIGPSAEGSFGGSGFNDSSGNVSRGGGTGAGGGGGRAGLGQNVNGFTVNRPQQIRARTVPNFSTRPVSLVQRSSRFNRRMSRIPQLRGISGNVNVSMQGRTAVINGVVENSQQIQLIERQLRLEPGVSRIVNQARVGF